MTRASDADGFAEGLAGRFNDPHGWPRRVYDPSLEAQWRLRVFEADPTFGPPYQPPALLAECGSILRRITPVPAGWQQLSDAALLALIHAPVLADADAPDDGD